MKRRTFLKVGGASVAATALSPMHAFAATSLRMSTWVPPTHHVAADTMPTWFAAIKEASGGDLNLTLDPAPIAAPPAQYDLVRDGAADLAYHVMAYTPGPFEIVRAAELPFLSPNAEVGSQAAYEWYDRNIGFEKEFKDVKVITIFVHGPGMVHTNKRVTNLDELAGVKLRVGGGGVAMAESLGAVPVAVPASKAYETVQKGVADGAMFPWESVKGFRLNELLKYHLEIPGGLYTTPFAVVMNRAKYDALSDANKQVLADLGGITGAKMLGAGWDRADVAAKELALSEGGHEINTLSEEQMALWAERVQIVTEDWLAKAKAAGLDGPALLDDLKATIAKYSA